MSAYGRSPAGFEQQRCPAGQHSDEPEGLLRNGQFGGEADGGNEPIHGHQADGVDEESDGVQLHGGRREAGGRHMEASGGWHGMDGWQGYSLRPLGVGGGGGGSLRPCSSPLFSPMVLPAERRGHQTAVEGQMRPWLSHGHGRPLPLGL